MSDLGLGHLFLGQDADPDRQFDLMTAGRLDRDEPDGSLRVHLDVDIDGRSGGQCERRQPPDSTAFLDPVVLAQLRARTCSRLLPDFDLDLGLMIATVLAVKVRPGKGSWVCASTRCST